MCMPRMMRNPTVSIQGTMDPSSYSMTKPPNVTIDTEDGRTRRVHLNRCKTNPFQVGSPTPLAVNDFTGSHLANGPLIESEIRIDTDSAMNLRRGIAVHLKRSQVIKNQDNSLRTNCPKAPTLQRCTCSRTSSKGEVM